MTGNASPDPRGVRQPPATAAPRPEVTGTRYSSVLRAHHSLRSWAEAIAGGSRADSPTTGAEKPAFPYAELVSVVRERGIRSPDSGLVESIGDAARLAAWHEVGGFTPDWLACLADTTSGRPSYASYIQFPLFEQYCRVGDFLARARSLSISLIADMVRNELVSSTVPPSRITAAVRLVMELCADAAVTSAPSIESREQARSACSRVLAEQADRVPSGLLTTPLPTTPAPDEYLFIRSVQSMELLTLERLCRGDLALRRETVDAVPIHQAPVPDRSLGRVIAGLLPRLPAQQAANLRAAVAAVDKAWTCWKRAHYGVTKRVIGDVPGTGGTNGLGYLKQHMNTPLLAMGGPM